MSELAAKAKREGWYLSESHLTEQGSKPLRDILADALKWDLKEFGAMAIPVALPKCTTLNGPIILQVNKIRNIAVQREEQELNSTNRFFKLSLTDGTSTWSALEMEQIAGLKLDTPPGAKIKLTGPVEVEQGLFLLTPSNTKLLGGSVQRLLDTWQAEQMAHKRTINKENQPPPFIPFGQPLPADKLRAAAAGQFKSLERAGAELHIGAGEDDDSEFAQLRADKIAQLAASAKLEKQAAGLPDISQLNIAGVKTTGVKPPAAEDDEDEARRGRGGRRGRSGKRGRGRRGSGSDEEIDSGYTQPDRSTGFSLADFATGDLALAAASVAPTAREEYPSQRGELPRGGRGGGRGFNDGPRGRGGRPQTAGPNFPPNRPEFTPQRGRGRGDDGPRSRGGGRGRGQSGPPQRGSYDNRNQEYTGSRGRPQSASNFQRQPYQEQRQPYQEQRGPDRPTFGRGGGPPQRGFVAADNFPTLTAQPREENRRVDQPMQYDRAPVPQQQRPIPSQRAPVPSSQTNVLFGEGPKPREPMWRQGEKCRAVWRDGLIYNAQVVQVRSDGCLVMFTEYGEQMTVPWHDLKKL